MTGRERKFVAVGLALAAIAIFLTLLSGKMQ